MKYVVLPEGYAPRSGKISACAVMMLDVAGSTTANVNATERQATFTASSIQLWGVMSGELYLRVRHVCTA